MKCFKILLISSLPFLLFGCDPKYDKTINNIDEPIEPSVLAKLNNQLIFDPERESLNLSSIRLEQRQIHIIDSQQPDFKQVSYDARGYITDSIFENISSNEKLTVKNQIDYAHNQYEKTAYNKVKTFNILIDDQNQQIIKLQNDSANEQILFKYDKQGRLIERRDSVNRVLYYYWDNNHLKYTVLIIPSDYIFVTLYAYNDKRQLLSTIKYVFNVKLKNEVMRNITQIDNVSHKANVIILIQYSQFNQRNDWLVSQTTVNDKTIGRTDRKLVYWDE
ncbi:hypothetical protein RHO15_00175 [Utexia brackfieldae]|uniref:hypothetical protein n=1 Tax=Utexia brackfieldae TaxID=3074108 RepID=UPI00370D663F